MIWKIKCKFNKFFAVRKLNLQRPQSRKLFPVGSLTLSTCCMCESSQNKMICHVYYTLFRFWQHLVQTGKLQFFLKKRKRHKQLFRCTLKAVVHMTLLTFIFLFMYDDDIKEKQTTVHGLWKDLAEKKLLLLHHFIKELDWFCFLSPRFPFQKDAQKPLLFGTRNREGFSPGGTTSPQMPSVKSLYGALSNQPIAIFLVFNTFA